MKYIKQQVLHDRKIGDRQLVITGDGNIQLTPASGTVTINGDLRVTGSSTGATNQLIYYVSLDGNDSNDGLAGSSDRAKRTIKSAVEAAPAGATIQLAPGDYYENNPITLKERQTVRGDSLRNTQVWPLNKGGDMFFVDNACYIFQITFRGMSDPGWCVQIKPGALVTTSPYVQNCSNINGPWLNDGTEFIPFETIQIEGATPEARPIINNPDVPLEKRINESGGGNGMLVDGNQYDQRSLVFSMVADAFTQIAQGGIGFHITNFGYTQIVSCFSVFTRIGFLATNGGYLSISNSVSDFGTFAIIADGLFDKIYTTARPDQNYYSTVASVTVNNTGSGYSSAPIVTIDPPTTPGGIQAVATASIDAATGKVAAISIDNPGSGYNFRPNITFIGGGFDVQATATANLQLNKVITVNSLRDQPQVGSIIAFEGDDNKYYVTATDVSVQPFIYNESVCRRDVRRMVDAIVGDMVMETNYQALAAGRSYLRATSQKVLLQQLAPTVFGLEAARDEMLSRIPDSDLLNEDARYAIIEGFATAINIIEQGDSTAAPDLLLTDLTTIDSGVIVSKDNIIANREFIVDEITAYISEQFTNLSYNQSEFETEITNITIGNAYDVALGTNYNAIVNGIVLQDSVAENQTIQKLAALEYLKTRITSLSSVSANSIAVTRAEANIDEIIDIVTNGIINADPISWNEPTGVIITRANAKDQLVANKDFIIEDVVAFFNFSNPTLLYDEDKFRRDTGYIIDALIYDVLYGSTDASITAARSYFVRTVSQLSENQKNATVASYERLQTLVNSVVQGQTVSVTAGNLLTQDKSSNNASGVEADKLNTLIQYTIDVIEENTADTLPVISYPSTSWVFGPIADASSSIFAQRNNFASDTTDWILDNYPDFTYDREKCKRDVGLIIDAVARDIRLNTNHNTIVAGLAYRRATASIVDAYQLPATIMALRYLGTLVENAVSSNPTLVSRVTDRFETLTTIIEYGTLPSEGTTYPSPNIASQELIDSARQLQDNRTFLIEETIAYTNLTYPTLVYDEEKCRRDTGYLIDTVTHDMLYGGNRSILVSARSYFDDGVSQIVGQEAETIDSLEHLKAVSSAVIEGTAVTPTTGNNEIQVLDPDFGTTTQSSISEGLYDIVIDAITNGNLLGTPSNSDPDYSWLPSSTTEAANNLISLDATLQQQVIDYITNNIISFTYNVAKCQRDTSYIIDAAVYDMMYGGNKQTRRAAEAYYSNAVIVGQESITEFTYKHLAQILSDIAQDIAITPSEGNTTPQVIGGTAGSTAAASYIFTMVEKIAEVIRLGSTNFLPTEIDHSYSTLGDADLNARRELILADLDAIENETIRLLNLQFGGVAELTLFPGLLAVEEGTLGSMQNVSTVSTSGHAFEYVGAGITYNALPFFGGSPISAQEFVETNSGKVFAGGTVDQIGNFKVGNFFNVNALTGAITLNANEINLSGLSSIGPFQRDGIPVGVELKEVSNSTNLISSIGSADVNTVPTQFAVVSYVENRYLNKLTGGTVQGDVTFDENITVDGGNLTTISSTFNLIDDNANIINFAGGATEINIGATIGTTTINNDVVIDGSADIFGDVTIIGDVNVTIPDEVEQAFSVTQGTEDYISVDTRETFEKITFGGQPKVEIQNVTNAESGTLNTGALVVDGGVSIAKNVSIGGDLYFEGTIISTSSGSLSLFNNAAAAVDAFGAATQINLGSSGIVPGNFIVNNDYIKFTSVYNLKLPTGNIGERGDATQGEVRFNTTLGIFEGYDGIAWNGLGSVRDVDGNTFIRPESAPGANENELMFYTDGLERMNLSTERLRIDDTITQVYVEGVTQSTSPDNGQLVVEGGVGIEKNLNVRGNLRAYNDALIEGNTTITGNLTVGTFDSVVDTVTLNANTVVNVWDNTVQAFEVLEGTNSYFKITTSDGNETAAFDTPRVLINNTTESTNSTTGALTVAGGVGIGGNLYVAGGFTVGGSIVLGDDVNNDTFTVIGDTTFTIPDNTTDAFSISEGTSTYLTVTTTNGLEVAEFGTVPRVLINNTTESTNKDTGALVVNGGVGIELNANIGIDLTVGRNTVITGDLAVNGADLTTTATTFNLINTDATTVNFAGAATTINIGAATGTVTFNNEQIIFDSVKTIQLPVGTTNQRPTAATGQVRFNTTLGIFEGYDGIAWNGLGSVRDVDGNTFIRPESAPGTNNDELEFFTAGTRRAIISNTDFIVENTNQVSVLNTTQSNDFSTGALTVAGGVGIAKNLSVQGFVTGNNNGVLQLTNLSTDVIDIRANTILAPDGVKLLTNAPDSAVDDIVYPMTFAHHSISGTPVAGSGTGIKFELETTNDNFEIGGIVDVVSLDLTGGQEDFDMAFSTMISGSIVEKLRLGEDTSTFSTDVTINNNQLLTTQTAFNLLDDTATTINFAGAATVLNIGAAGGLTTIDQNVQVNENVTIDGTLALTNVDLEVQYGGTGVSEFTVNGILYGNTASPVQVTDAAGTSDTSNSFQILTVTSDIDATPVWTDTIDGGSF